MVDSMANSVEDYLIEGLSFKLQPGASYVTDRRSVNFFAAGSNVYTSASGARVIRINLTGDSWLYPATVRVSFTLVRKSYSKASHRWLGFLQTSPLYGWWNSYR